MGFHVITIIVALFLGVAVGSVYFGGLWWTVQRVPTAKHPALLTLGSFLGRTLLAVGAFYGILRYGQWIPLLAALAGFIAARIVIVRHVRRPIETV